MLIQLTFTKDLGRRRHIMSFLVTAETISIASVIINETVANMYSTLGKRITINAKVIVA